MSEVRTVEKMPEMIITVSRQQLHARAERLGFEEAERAIEVCQTKSSRNKCPSSPDVDRLDGSEEDFCSLAHLGIVVTFQSSLVVSEKRVSSYETQL
jgi:hypothetical protein